MTNNRKIANSILKHLRDNGLTPVDIQFGNGYFIFEIGDDGVCHFHLREIKGWKFAMWIDPDNEKYAVQFFAQYESLIDKFKPSASLFCQNIDRKTLKAVADKKCDFDFAYLQILEMVKHIRFNPRLAFVQEDNYSYFVTEPLLKRYIADKRGQYETKLRKIKDHLVDDKYVYVVNYLSAKLMKLLNPDLIDDIEICDNNTDDFICSPRWRVKFIYHQIIDDDKLMIRMIDRFIESSCYGFTRRNSEYVDYIRRKDGSLVRV